MENLLHHHFDFYAAFQPFGDEETITDKIWLNRMKIILHPSFNDFGHHDAMNLLTEPMVNMGDLAAFQDFLKQEISSYTFALFKPFYANCKGKVRSDLALERLEDVVDRFNLDSYSFADYDGKERSEAKMTVYPDMQKLTQKVQKQLKRPIQWLSFSGGVVHKTELLATIPGAYVDKGRPAALVTKYHDVSDISICLETQLSSIWLYPKAIEVRIKDEVAQVPDNKGELELLQKIMQGLYHPK